MTMTRTDKLIALALAFCAAIAVALAASAGKADAAQPDYSNFKIAEFKIEIEGEQKTTWHRTLDAPDECSTGDHSFGREILHFETKQPIYLTATHMPGEFNPMMFSTKGQIEFPTIAKVERNFTPLISGPARQCEDNGGGAEVTPPDCGTKTVKNWAVNLQYAQKKKNALLLSGKSMEDPYVNCPGDSLDTFPWLIVERSGHRGNYIYAEVTQDELFDPNFQKWIAIGHGVAKDSTKTEWSSTEITYSISFKRIDR
ncbi:MAG: hypothetical protein AB7V58_14945 [Solirubrobacterales bacterium]